MIRGDLDGSEVANQGAIPALTDREVAPFGEQVLALLVEGFAAVVPQQVEMQVAKHFGGDGGPALVTPRGHRLEVVEKNLRASA